MFALDETTRRSEAWVETRKISSLQIRASLSLRFDPPTMQDKFMEPTPSKPWRRIRDVCALLFPLLLALAFSDAFAAGTSKGDEKETCYRGVAQLDPENASMVFRACQPLAERGDRRASGALGSMYWTGLGVKQDTSAAIRWQTRAAAEGDIESKFFLCNIYEDGIKGAPKDPVLAYMWCTLAAHGLKEYAKVRDATEPRFEEIPDLAQASLIRLASSMTPEQVHEAKQRAKDWAS